MNFFYIWMLLSCLLYRINQSKKFEQHFTDDGSKVFFYDKSVTAQDFDEAATRCSELGGTLSTLHNPQRLNAFKKLVVKTGCDSKQTK